MKTTPPRDLSEVLSREGWAPDAPPELIKMGGNNRAHRILRAGCPYLVKEYFQHPGDQRDRFGTERAFYDFLESGGICRIPKVAAWIEAERIGIFEFVEGQRPAEVTETLFLQAIAFLIEINRHRDLAAGLGDGSEACFSLDEHLACVQRRVERLAQIECADEADSEAAAFVGEELLPAWHGILEELHPKHGEEHRRQAIVSPSDFGFHNTLLAQDGRLVFLDFEYAGWDDPAKTVCDFFLQPEVPVPIQMLPQLLAALALPGLDARVTELLPVYRVKWACILLNEFLPAGRLRREFAVSGAQGIGHRRMQLSKARKVLAADLG